MRQSEDLLGPAEGDAQRPGCRLDRRHGTIVLKNETVVNDEKGEGVATADLLLHPVRLRVVQALLGGRALTTGELHTELPDVPAATLYRHVGVLADAGVLEVVAERRVRGSTERTYRLVAAAASVGPGEAATMTAEEHRR